MAGFVVGLTGGVAVGKSTVARLLVERGAELVEADRIGHELLAPEKPAWREIRRAFGTGVFQTDGTIDRRALGAVVFADGSARRRLNAIVHPRLLREIGRRVAAARRRGALVVVDAALLLEWGWKAAVDFVVVVDAPRKVQLARLARGGFSPREARNRVQSQLDRRAKAAAADWVVTNDNDRRALRRRVNALWTEIERRRERASAGPVRRAARGMTAARMRPRLRPGRLELNM